MAHGQPYIAEDSSGKPAKLNLDASGNLRTAGSVAAGAAGSATSTNQELEIGVLDSIDAALATIRAKTLAANDTVATYTWLDFGGANERISTIVYSSVIYPHTATRTFAYTLVGSSYRLDSSTWSVT